MKPQIKLFFTKILTKASIQTEAKLTTLIYNRPEGWGGWFQ